MERNKQLTSIRGVILDRNRVEACTKANLEPFYDYYGALKEKYHFIDALTFNMDETSLNFAQRFKSRIIVTRSTQTAFISQADRVDSTTLVLCIPAEGKPLDSTLLWSQKTIPQEFSTLPVHGIRVACEERSFQTRKSFENMMRDYYIPEMVRRRQMLKTNIPILLIMDGHGSRLSIPFIRECRLNNVIVLILPAHTTSLTQPMDCCPCGALKRAFTREYSIRVNTNRHESPSTDAVGDTKEPIAEMTVSPSEESKIPSQPITDDDDDCCSDSDYSDIPPLPPKYQSLSDSTAYTQSASSHRRLLAEILPKALDAGLSRIAIEAGWHKSGLVPFSKSLLDALPEGSQRSPAQRGNVPNISGKVLTDPETMIKIWEWRLSQIEKLLTKKSLDKPVASALIEEQSRLKDELADLKKDVSEKALQDCSLLETDSRNAMEHLTEGAKELNDTVSPQCNVLISAPGEEVETRKRTVRPPKQDDFPDHKETISTGDIATPCGKSRRTRKDKSDPDFILWNAVEF